MIKIKLPKLVRKLLRMDINVTPRQRVLDELEVLRVKRETIQALVVRGERLAGPLASVQKEIVDKVHEYKRLPE